MTLPTAAKFDSNHWTPVRVCMYAGAAATVALTVMSCFASIGLSIDSIGLSAGNMRLLRDILAFGTLGLGVARSVELIKKKKLSVI